ncbi:MAG: EAL domain-containing protein [Hydrogenimonas sp.]|nr:EAL domain-containing protein [Hydrogenimonas sp.]
MSSVFIARQPIVDSKKELFAYELLFRDYSDSVENSDFSKIEDMYATSRVAVNTLGQFGIEAIVGESVAFINADSQFILSDFITMLPKERFYIEVLEDVKVDDALVKRVMELRKAGYRFALDDMVLDEKFLKEYQKLLPLVDIVKIDITLFGIENLKSAIGALSGYSHLKFLAEKVETLREFELCKDAGCTLFQGYFFAKPEVKSRSSLDPSKSTLLEITGLLLNDESDLKEISAAFESAPDLSLQLFQFLNSARFAFKTPVRSISHAIMMVGRRDLLTWIYMIAYAKGNLSAIERSALVSLAMFRSRFLRKLSALHGDREKVQDMAAFMGTISLADTIFEMPMESIVEKINLDGAIKTALLKYEGTLAEYLAIAKSVEEGGFDAFMHSAAKIGLDIDAVKKAAIESYS